MAYTPINWDENAPVDATKLGKMDSEIDSNEQRITDVEDGTNPVAEAVNADTVDGQHYADIQSWVNNNADVPNANVADALASGLTNMQIASGTYISASAADDPNVNVGFTADFILLLTRNDDTGEFLGADLLFNTSNWSAGGTNNYTTEWKWIAVKKN